MRSIFDGCLDDTGSNAMGAPSGGYRDAATVAAVQQKLTEMAAGLPSPDPRHATLDPQGIDGIYGPNTASAVAQLQREGNQSATGIIDDWVLLALGVPVPSGGGGGGSSSGGGGKSSGGKSSSSGYGGLIVGALAAGAVVAVASRRRRSS